MAVSATAVWLTRPRGIQWRPVLDTVRQQFPQTTLWRRQMVLGSGKEFALIAPLGVDVAAHQVGLRSRSSGCVSMRPCNATINRKPSRLVRSAAVAFLAFSQTARSDGSQSKPSPPCQQNANNDPLGVRSASVSGADAEGRPFEVR